MDRRRTKQYLLYGLINKLQTDLHLKLKAGLVKHIEH